MIYYTKSEEHLAQHDTARRLLLWGLCAEYGMRTLPDTVCTQQGKPYFPDYPEIRFNYSHCRKGILCGISDVEIGVDIERMIPFQERLARYICHPAEWDILQRKQDKEREGLLTRIWTAKESYLKCVGTGIRVKLDGLDLSGCIGGGLFQGKYWFRFLQGEDYCAAVCEKRAAGPDSLILHEVLFRQEKGKRNKK